MKIAFKTLVFTLSLTFMIFVDFVDQTSPKVGFCEGGGSDHRPSVYTVECAGVARRTTRRVVETEAVVATTDGSENNRCGSCLRSETGGAAFCPVVSAVPIGTVVQTLPAGCTSVVVNGVSYSDCGGAFYKAAFQGNNLVYVVVEKPLK